MIGRMGALNLPGIGSQSIRKAEPKVGRFSSDFPYWKKQIREAWIHRFTTFEMTYAWDKANRQRETIEKLHGEIIGREDIFYPAAFLDLVNPPLLFSVLGDPSQLRRKGIAIVGTRLPSKQAEEAAYISGKICAKANRMVVSGLATGCDSKAHWGVVQGGGKTVAVLPSSLSAIYPMRNGRLARKIIENGGALISETFPETKMEAYHFVQRDRLIAALSQWIVVVEAGTNSGTMHTVRDGLQLSRKIAVLGRDQVLSEGCQCILQEKKGVWIKSVSQIL